MGGISPKLRWADKERLVEQARRCRDARLKTHYLVIVNLLEGRWPTELVLSFEGTAKALGMGKIISLPKVAHRKAAVGKKDKAEKKPEGAEGAPVAAEAAPTAEKEKPAKSAKPAKGGKS